MRHSCKAAMYHLWRFHHVTPCPLCRSKAQTLNDANIKYNSTLTSNTSATSRSSSPMASSLVLLNLTLIICIASSLLNVGVYGQMEDSSLKMMSDALEWPTTMSVYDELDEENEEEMDIDIESGFSRRSLFWRRMKYYISYGALSANRIPCPPRSGRSYYTHSCFKARGPVHPYSRGCSVITRCRR